MRRREMQRRTRRFVNFCGDQYKAAERLGISQPSVSRYLSGRAPLPEEVDALMQVIMRDEAAMRARAGGGEAGPGANG